jgi:16S rRNA (adenine1518-N6/adenine1519-N6)-dimethyltransferase
MDADASHADFPRTAGALRHVLEAAGLRPRKARGQHFLTDPQAVDAIVRDAGVGPGDHVVEVGTGPGLLTHALCESGADVVTFDVDTRLQRLARSLRPWPERVRFETGDVLAGKHALAPTFRAALAVSPAPPGRRLLVINLPYSVATPVVLGVLALPAPPDKLVVMVQEEVGAKMLARPGCGDFGVPSVAVGLKADGRILRRFGPQVFWPRPKVRSALLELVPRVPAALREDEHAPFAAFVTGLFTRRRKVLPTAIRTALPAQPAEAVAAALAAEGVDPVRRAESLAPTVLLALWRRLKVRP